MVYRPVSSFALPPVPLSLPQVILDPPRNGLHPDLVELLVQVANRRHKAASGQKRDSVPTPLHVVYMSCNAKSFVRDMDLLWDTAAGAGLRVEVSDVQAIDFFPHTPHVEVLSFMTLSRA